MILQLLLPLFFVAAYGLEDTVVLSVSERREKRTETTVEEFEHVCPTTGYKLKGLIWSTCSAGTSSMIGCVIDGSKVPFGQTFDDGTVEWLCLQDGDSVVVKPVSCFFKGFKHAVGEEFLYDGFFYECAATETGVAVKSIGCADAKGKLVKFGDHFRKSKFHFLCTFEAGKAITVGFQCIHEPTVQIVDIGERYTAGGYVYECQRKGKRSIRTVVVGCADPDGLQMVEPGQDFIVGQAVLRCTYEDETFSQKAVGCYAKDHRSQQYSKYEFGAQWYESYVEGFGHIMQCDKEGDSLHVKPVECIHHTDKGDYILKVGCGAYFGDKIFICKKSGPHSVQARFMSYPQGTSLDIFLYQHGLASCDSELKIIK